MAVMPSAEIRAEFAKDPDVCDMALIYAGAVDRPVWTKDQLKPYVAHTYADGRQSWFFDSFMFVEFTTSKANGASFATKYNNGRAARRADWEKLLHLQMGDESQNACYALNELIGDLKPQLGTPESKHTVVFTMPIAVYQFQNWGELDGKPLDFNNMEDRIAAQKWYIDQLLDLWNEMNYDNLDMIGFYWVDEFISEDNYFTDTVAKAISEYLHEKGLKLYWIPYYFSNPNALKWKSYGFDLCLLQPNYMFKLNGAYPAMAKLYDAIAQAKNYGMGLEVEFEADAIYGDGDAYADNRVRYNRLVDYLDKFDSRGAFDVASVSWYSGTRGLLDMSLSDHPKNVEMMDRMASIVEERHSRMWKVAGVDDVISDSPASKIIAIAGPGEIMIKDDCPDAAVYTVGGVKVASGAGRHNVAPGLYIVSDMCGNTQKLAVK